MGFTIDQVVPWGRNLEEYQRMFSLSAHDLDRKILSCADGPSSVNAELFAMGKKNYVSLDPIYQFSAQQINQRIKATSHIIEKQLQQHASDYQWQHYSSPQQLVKSRLATMDRFLEDFRGYHLTDRYVFGALPDLPFANHTFELVLCSHYLFTYSEQLDQVFHVNAILEMLRVGREVRIFPLLEFNGNLSRHLEGVNEILSKKGIHHETVPVDYEFQKGGNQMLKLTS